MSKSTKIFLTFFIIIFISFLFLPKTVVATRDINQYQPDFQVKIGQSKVLLTPATCPGNECSIGWIGDYIGAIYKYGVGLAAVLATIMMMVGGFLWLTSAGSPDRVGKAKEFITSALTGLILALFSFLILYTVNPELTTLKPLKVQKVSEVEVEFKEGFQGWGPVPNCEEGERAIQNVLTESWECTAGFNENATACATKVAASGGKFDVICWNFACSDLSETYKASLVEAGYIFSTTVGSDCNNMRDQLYNSGLVNFFEIRDY